MRMTARFMTAALLVMAPTAAASASASEPPPPSPAPLQRSAKAVPGRYIVTLQQGTNASALTNRAGVKPLFQYTNAMNGFAAELTPAQLDKVRRLSGVTAVEEDARLTVGDAPRRPAAPRVPASSWGLDRIDQAALPLDNEFNVKETGKGVSVYVVDTGIEYTHTEFGGRATFGYDAMGDEAEGKDCNGHGTHVAGTVGGATFGVAREASLVAVRVLDCRGQGTMSSLIAGFDWVAGNAKQPAVMNASLGGPDSPAVNNAVNAVFRKDVLPVVAAGNNAVDACRISPANASGALTVGATDKEDKQAEYSNYGPCLTMYAPGTAIVSAKLGGGSIAQNGTSMAAPHVAGVAALYKAQHPDAKPGNVARWLDQESKKEILVVSGRSPNRLLTTGGM
ncbi:S8 family peptidase [Streptomyces sp. ISL-98]|uniref:S8 family peptidase n=1 Tax=Streptomyces sp. ISL-98 TaxID=2819192 RepID=UPI001BE99DF8|nr:S8 family peptidase [Streptomyces sp. ISL-98]MBT2507605.1 S8 family peptidase [Streptomyces sp. ISL-98]